MDLYCKRCGEPWDSFGVRHGDMTNIERVQFFRGEGCPSCYGKVVEEQPFRALAMAALHDVLGDDIDGLTSMLEDVEYWD